MRFFSKSVKKKVSPKGTARFLHKALPKRREGRVVAKENTRLRVFAGVLLLWLLFFATLVYVAFFSLFFSLGEPEVSGTERVSKEVLTASLESQLSGKYFGIFPKRNFFLVQPRWLEAGLKSEYPLLASVAVTRIFPNGLSILVTEREKMLLWCLRGPIQNVGEAVSVERDCSLIDEDGRAGDAGRALAEDNSSSALFVTDTSGRAVTRGEKVLDPSYGTFVFRLHKIFPEQLGMDLGVEYTTVSRFANEVRATTSEGWEVYLNVAIPLETSLNTLRLLFEKELPQEKRASLAYIDVRTEHRVYYAFSEEGDTVKAEEGAPSDTSAPEKKADESKKKKE